MRLTIVEEPRSSAGRASDQEPDTVVRCQRSLGISVRQPWQAMIAVTEFGG